MSKFLTAALMLMLGLASAAHSTDDSIDVTPGNYNITTTTRSNMSPNPKLETKDECIREKSVNVKTFMPDDDACSHSNVQKSGNNLTFDLKCQGGNMIPAMIGKAEVSATSSTISSHYKMVGSFQGQEFSVDTRSEGKRTGDCM